MSHGDRGGTVVKVLCYKSEGSIPDGVIGIFHRHNPPGPTVALNPPGPTVALNPPGPTVALGSTQPLTEMCTRRISWG